MATRQNSAIDWRTVLLIGGGIMALLILIAIDTVADGIRDLLLAAGVSPAIAGNVGAVIFGSLVLLLVLKVIEGLFG